MNISTTFCMDGGQVKAGNDKDDTFVRMLQEVVRITPAIAYAIAQKYPNVIALMKGFRKHGPFALEDLKKGANRQGEETDRRIGSAISRRLYSIFTGADETSTDV